MFGQSIHRFAACRASCYWFIGRLPFGKVDVPVLRELAANDALELSGYLRKRLLVCVELLSPLILHLRAMRDRLTEILHRVLGQVEFVHAWPAQGLLGGL